MKHYALKYLQVGLSVLPAIKAQKRPAAGKHWKQYQNRLPTVAEADAWFSNDHDALCVITGKISGNLEMIDFDHKAELYPAWTEFVENNMPGLLDRLTIETTQRGGRHVFYRCENTVAGNLKLASKKLNGKASAYIETRGEGGLFLCYPTVGYNLLQNDFENIVTITEDERAVLILAATVLNEVEEKPVTYQPRENSWQKYDGRPGDDYNARADVRDVLKAHGWTYLGADTVNERWRRPGKAKGGLSATIRIADQRFYVFSSNAAPFEPGKTYLPFSVCTMLDYRGDYERAARELGRHGYGKPLELQPDPDVNIDGILNQGSKKATPVIETPEPATPVTETEPTDSNNPGPIPDEFFNVPGFISEYMKFCLDTAPYPSKPLAFCGALAMQSFLAGRKIMEPGGIRPNIYLLALAGSGTGKDWPRKINARIMNHINALGALGGAFASGEGIQDQMAANLAMLFQTDEIDGMLRAIQSGKDGRFESIMGTLLTFYTSADSFYSVRSKAGMEQATAVVQPYLTMLGTATPKYYYEALSERMLTNGFFSRMLIVDVGERPDCQMAKNIETIPESILTIAQFWQEKTMQYGGNLKWENPNPASANYSGKASQMIFDFQRFTDAKHRGIDTNDEAGRTVWTRAAENARKLALLYACSQDHANPRISEKAVEWATSFVKHQIERQIYMVGLYAAESEFHGLCLKLKEKLRGCKGWRMPRSRLLKNMKMPARQFNDLVDTLEEADEIEVVCESTGRKISTFYQLRTSKKAANSSTRSNSSLSM